MEKYIKYFLDRDTKYCSNEKFDFIKVQQKKNSFWNIVNF